MKIAICFSGQMRYAIKCAPNIKRFIGDVDADYFIHTWDINQYKPYAIIDGKMPPWRKEFQTGFEHPVEQVTKEMYNEYVNLYYPKVHQQENFDSFKSLYPEEVFFRSLYLQYSWRKSFLYC